MRNLVLLILFIASPPLLVQPVAQEIINYAGVSAVAPRHKNVTADTLELPFTDDFAYPENFADPHLWQDTAVYINNGYPVNPPTIGVATLDALNRQGDLYASAAFNEVTEADKMASAPINLQYPGDRTIFLSFYYQPQGRGDAPEKNDSLVVDFYDPQAESWHQQWSAGGTGVHEFKFVALPVDQERFLKDGFRFRFRNFVSLSGRNTPGLASNCDHWHIDYVRLDRNRSPGDSTFKDVAFVTRFNSFLKNYERMPWRHYRNNQDISYKEVNPFVYHNMDNDDRLIDSMKFVIKNQLMPGTSDVINAGAYNVPGRSRVTFNRSLGYTFPRNKQDSAAFQVKARLVTDNFDRAANNEATFNQYFYDDYAYDDGTAEAGYGLRGEGTKFARVAYKFYTYQKDTLQGVRMYFNSTRNAFNENLYFYLMVWDNNNGLPGEIRYEKTNYQPEHDSLNRFQTYPLQSYSSAYRDTGIVVQDTFFIGWIQTTTDLLNVGMDLDRNAGDKLYYNIRGTWKASEVEGALMMRPVFAEDLAISTGTEPPVQEPAGKLKLYPNPANNYIRAQLPGRKNSYITILNTSGRIVWQGKARGKLTVQVKSWQEGLYIVQVRTAERIYTGKFLIVK